MDSQTKKVIYFAVETIAYFILTPILITTILFTYTYLKFGNLLEIGETKLLEDGGLNLLLFQSFASPLLILIAKKAKLRFFEFWSVLFLTIPIKYFLYGRLNYEPGDEYVSFWPIIIVTLLYFEIFYKKYLLRELLRISPKYNLNSLLFKSKKNAQ
jgi:hypothetical protein